MPDVINTGCGFETCEVQGAQGQLILFLFSAFPTLWLDMSLRGLPTPFFVISGMSRHPRAGHSGVQRPRLSEPCSSKVM